MSWKDTLHGVGQASSDVADSVEQMISVIDGVLAASLDRELLERAVGGKRGEELIARLDAIGRLRTENGLNETIETAQIWSLLRGLPNVIEELSRVLRGGTPVLDGHLSIRSALSEIEQAPSSSESFALRCPRCRSRQVHLNTESLGDGRRLVEIGCFRCGLSDDRVTEDPSDPVYAIAEWNVAG